MIISLQDGETVRDYAFRVTADHDAALALLREVRDAVLDVIPYDDVIPIDLLARIEELLEKETP